MHTNPPLAVDDASKRYPWIDSVRGVAILMVIAVHASHGLKGSESLLRTIFSFGGYGVQLFFVASAMTLCMSLASNYGKPHWLMKYAARRFFRIAPMYYIGIVLYFFWSFAKNYVQHGVIDPLPQYTPVNILANIFFIHGFFPEAYNNIVPGGWSIGVEMVFYVVFPFFFLLHRKFHRPLLISILLLLACYGLIDCVQRALAYTTVSSDFLYFNVANQLHVFVIGMCGFYYLPVMTRWPCWMLSVWVVGFFWLGLEVGRLSVNHSSFWILAAYAIAFVGLAAWMAKRQFSPAWLGEIGRRSFSMYVVHFLFMNIIDYSFNRDGGLLVAFPNLKALVHFSVAVVASFWLAGITQRWIENRGIQLGRRVVA